MATNFIDMMQPDLVAQQEALNRRQQLTDYLRQQSLQPIDPNQMTQTGAGAPNQAVPISPWQGLGKMAQGYFAGQSQTQNTADQTALSRQRMQGLTKLLQGILPGGTQQSTPQAANGEPLQGIQTAPDGTPYADTGNQSSPLVAALGGVPKQQSTSSDSRFGLANLLRGSIADSFLPGAGAAMLAETAPTDLQKNDRYLGITPSQSASSELAKRLKEGYIAPTRLGEGAYATQDGQVQGLPSAAPPGFINAKGPDGQWQTQPVQGGLSAVAASKGAIEGATQGAQVEKVQNADQTYSYIPKSQLIATANSAIPTSIPSVGNSQPSPQQMAAIQADIQKNGNPNPTIDFNSQPSGPQRFGQTQAEQIQQAGDTAQATRYGGERGALAAEKPVATLAFNDAASNLDRLSAISLKVANHPGLSGTVGIMGVIPNVPGSNASDAAAQLDTLKSQASFSVLQAMRNASKTGGALGQVSDVEEQMLANNLAALQKAQSPKALKESLLSISAWAAGAKSRLKNAYDMTYNGASATQPAGASQPTITTKSVSWGDLK